MSSFSSIDVPRLAPSSQHRWVITGLLFAGMTINYIDRTTLAVAAPVLEREFGLSKGMIGVLLSVFFWVYAAVQLPSGWIIDRFDIKKTYAWAFAEWSLVSAATGLVNSILGLSFMRGLLALGESVSTPASIRSIRYLFQPAERGFPTGVYNSGTKLGPAIGTPLCAVLLVHYGWRGMFFVTGLLGLVWLAPWLYFYQAPTEEKAHKLGGGLTGVDVPPLWAYFRLRTMWGIFLGFLCYGYVLHVYLTWLPGYLVSEWKMSMLQMGFWGSIPFVSYAIMIPVAGLVADRIIARGRRELAVRKAFVGVGLFLGMLIIPAAFVNTGRTAIFFFTASTSGLGLATANIWAITQTLAPVRHVGTWCGIQNFGGVIGAALAPLMTGLLVGFTGSFLVALILAGFLSCLGIFCYIFLIDQGAARKGNHEPVVA
jgi:MFS family permease